MDKKETEIDVELHLKNKSKKSEHNAIVHIFKELEGNRTYAIGFGLIVWGLLGLFLGKLGQQEGVRTILEGLAFMGLRSGIAKLT